MPSRNIAAQLLLCSMALVPNLFGSSPPFDEARARLPEPLREPSLQLPSWLARGHVSSPRPANRHPRVPLKCGIGSDPNGAPCP
jgi:hypothetical protein